MKKFFTLFALLVAIVTGAWAQSTTLFEMKNVTGITKENGDPAVENTDYVGPGEHGSGSDTYIIEENCLGILMQKTVLLTATYDYNGKVEAYNGHKKKGNLTVNTSTGVVTISNSGDSYLKVTLPSGTTIAEGDKITVTGTSTTNTKIRLTGEAGNSKGVLNESWPYEVPSGSNLIQESGVFYIYYKGGNMSQVTSIKVERPSEDEVATPTVTLSGKQVTLACTTAESSIYYTTDGTEPTLTSTLYSEPFDLTASCTVRAKAFKGENESEERTQDCYIDNSSATGILQVMKYNGGTVSGTTWTDKKKNKELTLTASTNDFESINLSGTSDGFKLNHTDTYTLTPSSFVKITKIVVVGKTWLAGDAATISIDGFTPASGTFYDADSERNTYVKSIEFTPSSELDYGAAVTITPGTNQLGAYLEVYGVKNDLGITYAETEHGTISGPATGKTNEQITLTITPDDGYELTGLTVKRNSDGADRSSWCSVSVKNGTFNMYTEDVTVSGTFTQIQTPIVTMPTETRTGYAVTWSGTDASETTVSGSYTLNGQKVYELGNGKSMTLTVPAITTVSKIVLTGTCKDNSTATVKIEGTNSEQASGSFTTRTGDVCTVTFEPTTQTTSYTISSTTKGSWVQIKIYGEEAASEDLSLSNVTGKTYGFGGYCGSKNFTVTNGTAYKASFANSKVVLTSLDGIVPAGEGVVIAGTPGANATINFTDEAADVDMEGNNLHGTTVRTLTSTLKGEYAKFITLQKSTGKFIPYTGEYFPANRAYMLLDSEGAAQSFDIVFDSETGVDAVAEAKAELGVKKVVENGKLVISNNGKKYNAAGAVIK